MKRWLIILCFLPTLTFAQNVGVSGGGAMVGTSSRTATICLIPDQQRTVSATSWTASNLGTGCQVDAGFCVGGACDSSPYCSVSWRNTGKILMSNLAYSLTGQWDQIDYSAIKAKDNILSKRGYSLGPGKCDLILSLGDMTDVPNDTGYGNHVASSAATLTSLGYDYQNETNREFWSIIKASGVPYIPNQGNHDPWVWFQSLMTMLDYENESFYYDHEATYGLSYAMLVPTNLGRPLCVLSVGFSDELFDPATFATRSANTYAWVAATVGCGGNYPTIYISHYTLLNNAAPGGAGARTLATTTGYTPYALPGVTGARELFMAAGGHDTSNVSAKSSYTGLFGTDADATVYTFFSNWQEHLRRPSLANGDSYSNKDGYGTMYTVVSIDAGNKRLCAHDWSPYWQSQSTTGNGQATSVDTTSACFDFDFDAR